MINHSLPPKYHSSHLIRLSFFVTFPQTASYFCGKDWSDAATNCHQPCPIGSNDECNDPEHLCYAFVEPCRATMSPIGNSGASSPDSFPSSTSGSLTFPQTAKPSFVIDANFDSAGSAIAFNALIVGTLGIVTTAISLIL